MIDGQRESETSWTAAPAGPEEPRPDRSRRSWPPATEPGLLAGAGARSFPQTRHQRCWVHKTVNVLDKLPKSQQPAAKSMLHEIWMSATRADAIKAFDRFIEVYGTKWPRATECLEKDRAELLAFYDFPAEHWQHLRTSNPIESTFATVRLRTYRTKGPGSREAGLAMAFKLATQGRIALEETERQREAARPDRRHRVRRRRTNRRLTCRGRPQLLEITPGRFLATPPNP